MAAQAELSQAWQGAQHTQVLRLHILQLDAAQQRQCLALQQARGKHAAVRIEIKL